MAVYKGTIILLFLIKVKPPRADTDAKQNYKIIFLKYFFYLFHANLASNLAKGAIRAKQFVCKICNADFKFVKNAK